MTALPRFVPTDNTPLAVTCGDPAGIGPDITLLAWANRRVFNLPAFYVLGDPLCFTERATRLNLDVPIKIVSPNEATDQFDRALPIVSTPIAKPAIAGVPDVANAAATIQAIAQAVADVQAGRARAIVTNPIAKSVLYDAGFAHPGHTEFLGALARDWLPIGANTVPPNDQPVMMLAGPDLRTVPITVHVSLSDALRQLSMDLIVTTARIVARDLRRRFQIPAPRLAFAGLNPHAGEDGAMGLEERDIILPAIEALRIEGIDASGPFPADTLFHSRVRKSYDVAMCMYHDQALIPVKTIAFDETVNVTLGLPFVRTSPDHGTAFDIAGTGRALPNSFVAALRMADQLTAAASDTHVI